MAGASRNYYRGNKSCSKELKYITKIKIADIFNL